MEKMGAFSDRRVAGTKKRRRRSSSSLYPLLLLTALARSFSRHLSDDVVVWMGSVGRRRKEKEEEEASRKEKEQEDKGRGREESGGESRR